MGPAAERAQRRAVLAFWSILQARYVEFVVAEKRVEKRESWVEDTSGNRYGVGPFIYRRLQPGQRVRCRVTEPFVLFAPEIVSCDRAPPRG